LDRLREEGRVKNGFTFSVPWIVLSVLNAAFSISAGQSIEGPRFCDIQIISILQHTVL
jgi:hypothetical protein